MNRPRKPLLQEGLARSLFLPAERGGFEPPRPLSEPNGLANIKTFGVTPCSASELDPSILAGVAPEVAPRAGSVPVAASASGTLGVTVGTGKHPTAACRSWALTLA